MKPSFRAKQCSLKQALTAVAPRKEAAFVHVQNLIEGSQRGSPSRRGSEILAESDREDELTE